MNQDNANNETLIRMDVLKWADYLSTLQPIAMNGMAFRIEHTHRPEMNATYDGIDVRIIYANGIIVCRQWLRKRETLQWESREAPYQWFYTVKDYCGVYFNDLYSAYNALQYLQPKK